MICPRILGEACTLMLSIGDVGPSDLLKEFELSHNCLIDEVFIERRGGSVVMYDLGGQSESLLRCSVIDNLDIIDDAVNDFRLC